jgi:hypothetical protein
VLLTPPSFALLDMVRTLGGCVAVVICSAVHREYLNDRLLSFLSPTQIKAVLNASGYIAELPEETRDRIGKSFGGSYSKQIHIILTFARLNIIVTIILALIRKRIGVYDVMPQRKEANEFTRAADAKTDDVHAVIAANTGIYRSSMPDQDSETIIVTDSKH